MPPPGEAALPPLPSSFETLPVPHAAETQGGKLTSKLKQTLTITEIPSIICNPVYVRSVHFRGVILFFSSFHLISLSAMHIVISCLITKHLMV